MNPYTYIPKVMRIAICSYPSPAFKSKTSWFTHDRQSLGLKADKLSAGKSLTVHEVARTISGGQCIMASINCMSLQQPAAVFARSYSSLKAASGAVEEATNTSGILPET